MRTNPYQNYLENEILSADPLKLVIFLYRGALDSIANARRHLAAGDIRSRSQSITQAMEVVAELIRSLDLEAGGEIGRNLARIYDYVLGLLAAANTKQIDAPLAEAEKLLDGLLGAWQQCSAIAAPPAEAPKSRIAYDNHEPGDSSNEPVERHFSCAY
jgi:flagellar protein FliS